MKKNMICWLLMIALSFMMFSCGEPDGGNSECYGTSCIYASYDDEPYTADIRLYADVTANDGLCDGGISYTEDEVSITVTSNEKANLADDVEVSDIKITSYTVVFTPIESDSPAVPTKTFYQDFLIEPGSSTDIVVRVIDSEDKWASSSHALNYTSFAAAGVSYEYTITVNFKVEEIETGIDDTISASFFLEVRDINDGNCT